MSKQKITVSEYLVIRMKQIGMSHLFGVPGNFIAPLLNTIEADSSEDRLRLINCTNENIAGYAADGFASVKGTKAPAGLFVTAGVGSLSAANAIAGSFMEKVPVLVLNGVFTFNQYRRHELTGILSSHMLHNPHSEETIMREISCDAQVVTTAKTAPSQIDTALQNMIYHSQPVYLEIHEDVLRMECSIPTDIDWAGLTQPRQYSDKKTKQAIAATIALIGETPIANQNLIYAGEGIKRFHMQKEFEQLLETSGIPYATSMLSKSVLSEDNPYFLGQFNGKMLTPTEGEAETSSNQTDTLKLSESESDMFEDAEKEASTASNSKSVEQQLKTTKNLIQLGVAKVSVHYSGFQPIGHNHILVSQGAAMIGGKFIGNVDMKKYITGLASHFKSVNEPITLPKIAKEPITLPNPNEELGYDAFGNALNYFINNSSKKFTVVSDAGFVLRTASKLHIKEANSFYSQSDWLAIGYSVPGALGVQIAHGKSSRVIIATGDGAFQETATALSDHVHHGAKPVVLVLDNGIHGVEQFLVNPNPFRSKDYHQKYDDSSLNTVNGYNRLPHWDYVKFAESFGAKACRVINAGELHTALEQAADDEGSAYLIQVVMPRNEDDPTISCNLPKTRQTGVDREPGSIAPDARFIGEDEYPAPEWPNW